MRHVDIAVGYQINTIHFALHDVRTSAPECVHVADGARCANISFQLVRIRDGCGEQCGHTCWQVFVHMCVFVYASVCVCVFVVFSKCEDFCTPNAVGRKRVVWSVIFHHHLVGARVLCSSYREIF